MPHVWQATLTVRDDKRQTSEMLVYILTPDFLVDQVHDPVEFAQELAVYVDACITGAIVNITLTVSPALPDGIKTVPDSESDVEEGLLATYRTAGNWVFKHRIPTWREDLLNADGTVFGTVETGELFAMMTQPEDLPANWAIGACDRRGDDITVLVEAHENFKRSRPR